MALPKARIVASGEPHRTMNESASMRMPSPSSTCASCSAKKITAWQPDPEDALQLLVPAACVMLHAALSSTTVPFLVTACLPATKFSSLCDWAAVHCILRLMMSVPDLRKFQQLCCCAALCISHQRSHDSQDVVTAEQNSQPSHGRAAKLACDGEASTRAAHHA